MAISYSYLFTEEDDLDVPRTVNNVPRKLMDI